MVEESESYSDIELDMPPKLTFEELRQQVMKDPPLARKRLDLLRTLYYYSKDAKKHSRIIKVLFWALIVPLLQDKNNRTALFGLKSLNQLITNESSHEQIIGIGKAQLLSSKQNVSKVIKKAREPAETAEGEKSEIEKLHNTMNTIIESRQNPIRILANIILRTEPSVVMIEATKAIRNLSRTEEVIDMLMQQNELLKIYKEKILMVDSQSQENIMMTISAACKKADYRQSFVNDDEFVQKLLAQIKSVSKTVTLQTLRICRQLAKDEHSLEKLQGTRMRLSRELIYAFQWLDAMINHEEEEQLQIQTNGIKSIKTDQNANSSDQAAARQASDAAKTIVDGEAKPTDKQVNDAIFREISKTFEYILKYYDLHKKQIQIVASSAVQGDNLEEDGQNNTENQIIETIVQLGRSTRDLKTTLNAATSLAHITEVLDCNQQVATDDAIEFMMDMLKDTKNVKHHRQGCRYFANLSFYKIFRDKLIKKEIATFLLKAIEGHLEEDTIKHAAIALANLSSHKDFMKSNGSQGSGNETSLSSKAEKWMIKPLIHLLDSAQDHKIDLIQSACITLCNMASKPSLHKHFVHEPEISTFKNCLANPIDKENGNELTRFMIKLVCNLTKNPEVLPHLLKKGFLEILFDLLNHEREKEIFGNVVTAIAYLSVHQEAQEQIKRNNIIPKILEPLTQISPVDQKMIIIAITSMLFNGPELQKEFIKNNGLGKLLFFLQQKQKIFYQLACKCFSLLSENEEILNKIIDQECLNTIIISCLRSKDIDLETLKEITKIFINLILWRKIKPEIIETTCCLCDIGLMIDDLDMNILAMFCLNSLSEAEEHHEKIIQQGATTTQIMITDKQGGSTKNGASGTDSKTKASGLKQDEGKQTKNDQPFSQSIFPRINYLLENCKLNQNCDKIDSSKRELLITLITSFYLNLARNKNNRDLLLRLNLFQRLNNLMHQGLNDQQTHKFNKTALCYTNTIFSKLLKYQQSRDNCMREGGQNLFISILKDEDNKHLFLETLDSIKLFLMTRTNLDKFKAIPLCIYKDCSMNGNEKSALLDRSCPELNVSFLQVLAILSFEKENHDALKKAQFLELLQNNNIFADIFDHFDKLIQEEKNLLEINDPNQNIPLGNNRKNHVFGPTTENSEAVSAMSHGSNKDGKRKQKHDLNHTRQVELALAISIILSNLSNDEAYIKILLGANHWERRYKELQGHDNSIEGEGVGAVDNMSSSTTKYQNEFILQQDEVTRITSMFNLLSHPDPFISEQISILLANVSNSQYFRFQFISDRAMKSIIKILRFSSRNTQTEVSLLAILITILNVSAMGENVQGIENMHFLESLEMIIQNEAKPLEQRSIALMAISNIFTQFESINISEQTQEFAFYILKNWKHMQENDNQNKEVIKNLVYASLILFYNLLLRKFSKYDRKSSEPSIAVKQQSNTMEQLINCLNDYIMDDFQVKDNNMIVNVVLHLITLFTKHQDTACILFSNKKILQYIFNKLKQPEEKLFFSMVQQHVGKLPSKENQEMIRLATLALSRLSSKFESPKIDKTEYIAQLQNFDNFKYMIDYVKQSIRKTMPANIDGAANKLGNGTNQTKQSDEQMQDLNEYIKLSKETLKYLLNVLENLTSVKELRVTIDSDQLFTDIKDLFTENLDLENKKSLINIMFNLNFSLKQPQLLEQQKQGQQSTQGSNSPFLDLLFKTYEELGLLTMNGNQRQTYSPIQRKIISIVVVASALESNHGPIVNSGFYTQFKRNVNDDYTQLLEDDEEIELFGLVNIALNKRKMDLIYRDLKKIHKIAVKNDKIDFKTKVDLFTEISKFIAKMTQKQQSGDDKEENQDEEQQKNQNKVDNLRIQECLSALIYTMVRLTVQLDTNNFSLYKYFLLAILETTRNLKTHLKYLIRIRQILDFLVGVLKKQKDEFTFQVTDIDQQVLVFSLKMIVCEIFFNFKHEKEFFQLTDISQAVELLIAFSQDVLVMSIDKKTQLVSNTLRLLSQMITTIHQQDNGGQILKQVKAISFVKKSLQLSRDLQPCINIDALFCLNNMMNIQEIAESEELCNMETLWNAFSIYFAFRDQIELDECIVTYVYSISKLPKYQSFLKDTSKVLLFKLMERHINGDSKTSLESCRQKLFSTFHNLTQTKEICLAMDIKQFVSITNQMLEQTKNGKYQSDNIHELAMKTLINLCRHSGEAMLDVNLKDLLNHISEQYGSFKNLAKQYALRLVTILTSEWKPASLEPYLEQIMTILSQFISQCKQTLEVKLVLINLEKIASNKSLMKKLAEIDCQKLVTEIAKFLTTYQSEKEYAQCTEQLLRFCKKMSQQSKLQENLIKEEIYKIALTYIISRHEDAFNGQESSKAGLQTVQNVMKMVKHLFEGTNDKQVKQQIQDQVEANRKIVEKANEQLKTLQNENDQIAVILVQIISCFNSISNKLDPEQLSEWIKTFSVRLIDAAKNQDTKSNVSFMERYVFIIELLVVKNLNKIDKEMTKDLLTIYKEDIDTKYFSKTIWYKMLKILAHLIYLQDIESIYGGKESNENDGYYIEVIDKIFTFVLQAYETAKESLSFLYLMRVVMLLTKKSDTDSVQHQSTCFQQVLNKIFKNFHDNKHRVDDDLIKEILLYQIDYFRFLMNNTNLSEFLNKQNVVRNFVEMLDVHKDHKIVKALSTALQESSKTTVFYPDLLSNNALNTILMKILENETEQASLDPLYETLKNVISQTKTPIKYLLATSVLKVTEDSQIDWTSKQEQNVLYILRVLHSNLFNVDMNTEDYLSSDLRDVNIAEDQEQEGGGFGHSATRVALQQQVAKDEYKGLVFKSHKYCLLAMTNILIKTKCNYIFTKKHKFTPLQVLMEKERTNFETDPQMNLRFLTLINIAFSKENTEHLDQTFEEKGLKDLIDCILSNINKFRNILDLQQSYFYDIPSLAEEEGKKVVRLQSDDSSSRFTTVPEIVGGALTNNIPNSLPTIIEADELKEVKHGDKQGSHEIVPKDVLEPPKNLLSPLKSVPMQLSPKNLQFQRGNTMNQKNQQPQDDSHLKVELPSLIGSKAVSSILPRSAAKKNSFADSSTGKVSANQELLQPEESHNMSQCSRMDISSIAQDVFFFEDIEEESQLTKIDAIKVSLCLSVEALYLMTLRKKRYACVPIIEHAKHTELFRFFSHYINQTNGTDTDIIKYVVKVIKIFYHCAEVSSLGKTLVNIGLVDQLADVARKVLQTKFGPQTNEIQTEVLGPILKTFASLNQSETIQIRHTQAIQEIINMIRSNERAPSLQGGEIAEIIDNMQEFLVDDQEIHQYMDYSEHIANIMKETSSQQLVILKQLDHGIQQKSIKSDQIKNNELGILIQIYQGLQERDSEPSSEQVSIIKSILKIVSHVYENTYAKEGGATDSQPKLNYKDDINQVIAKEKGYVQGITDGGQSNEQNPMVQSTVDLEETLKTFKRTIEKDGFNQVPIVRSIISILHTYSQSKYKYECAMIEYVLPCLEAVIKMKPKVVAIEKESILKIMQSLTAALNIKEEKEQILRSYDITALLLSLVKSKEKIFGDVEMYKMLNTLLRSVLVSPGVLRVSGDRLIQFLLNHQSKPFHKLGIFCLYCVALNLQDERSQVNIRVFENVKDILIPLISFVKDRQQFHGKTNLTSEEQKLQQKSDQIANNANKSSVESQELVQLRIVALQILVIVCEFQNSSHIKEKHMEVPSPTDVRLTQQIFVNLGFMELLIRKCLQDDGDMTLEEVRFVSRALCAVPAEIIIKENIPNFDKPSIDGHEKRLQEEYNKLQRKLSLNRGDEFKASISGFNVMALFKALTTIVSKYHDPKASYYALLTLLNLIYNTNLLAPTVQGKSTLPPSLQTTGPVNPAELKLNDLDYQMMIACLMKSGILSLVLIEPTLETADDEIIRVCSKIMIALVFKASKRRILIGESNEQRTMQQLQDLYRRLDLDFGAETRSQQDLLGTFVDKLHSFEIKDIQNDGYVQYIHMISQICLQTSKPIDVAEQRLRILPTKGVLKDLVQSWSASMDESKINEVILSSKENSDDGHQMKMLLYKFFFFNYIFQVTGESIMDVFVAADPSDDLKEFARDLPEVPTDQHDAIQPYSDPLIPKKEHEAKNTQILTDLLNALIMIVKTLRSRRTNLQLDKAIKSSQLNGGQAASANEATKEERKDRKASARGKAQDGAAPMSQDELRQSEELEQKSTSLAVVKMTLFNLQAILQKIIDSNLASTFNFSLQESQLDAFESLLLEYQENGDIVEPTYTILDQLLRLCAASDHPTVKVMESSNQLMRQAIKHTAVYTCQESFMFLKRYVAKSDKFRNKAEMEQGLARIAPPSMQNTDLEQQTTYNNGAAVSRHESFNQVPGGPSAAISKPQEAAPLTRQQSQDQSLPRDKATVETAENNAAQQQDSSQNTPPQDSSRPQ